MPDEPKLENEAGGSRSPSARAQLHATGSHGGAPKTARRPRCRNGFNTLIMAGATLDAFVRRIDDRELRALIRHCTDVCRGAKWARDGFRERHPSEVAIASATYYAAYEEWNVRRGRA